MPANPKKISFATASTDTMLKWLEEGRVRLWANCVGDWFASTGDGLLLATAKTPVAALRKLCRAVKKGTPDA